ncbi:hypothetical protein GCM10020000_47950 [Streptomyces olivoverticillatus]
MAKKWWFLTAAGLVVTAGEFAWLGSEDANGALTYAGRLTGVALICAALLELIAASALADCRNTRGQLFRYSPAAVLLGVLASFLVNIALLVLHIESFSYSRYLWFWLPMTTWSAWTLHLLYKQYRQCRFRIPKIKALIARRRRHGSHRNRQLRIHADLPAVHHARTDLHNRGTRAKHKSRAEWSRYRSG